MKIFSDISNGTKNVARSVDLNFHGFLQALNDLFLVFYGCSKFSKFILYVQKMIFILSKYLLHLHQFFFFFFFFCSANGFRIQQEIFISGNFKFTFSNIRFIVNSLRLVFNKMRFVKQESFIFGKKNRCSKPCILKYSTE